MNTEHSFWGRRKAGVTAEAEAEKAAVDARALAEECSALEQKSDAEILVELNLPDPDALQMGDDFTAFMSKTVPDRIRRRALRTLWRSNPVLANVDMLVDYGEDFTDSATVVENLQTAYQVGKGMLKHVEEMARQAEEAQKPSEPEEIEEHPGEDEEVLLAAVEEEEPVQTDEVAEVVEDIDTYDSPKPRRMTFRSEETA
ncbi:DUF3306 domain-containing protein [uncultured Tateyamaria sp.]|uniref:DUF3306 domain-containing protein n=1 Tax=uncultured Tateyamaria sp. TaxID=455651 RepID=UPI00262F65FC|nr:DUF3306 domain-containing protein [uncultured Tateyamaria sp.]